MSGCVDRVVVVVQALRGEGMRVYKELNGLGEREGYRWGGRWRGRSRR